MKDMEVANVAQLQLAGLALYIVLRRRRPGAVRDIIGGLILGCLVAFKPNMVFLPVLLGVSWIVDRRWKALIIQTISGLIALAAAFVCGCLFLHSWSAWTDWIRGLAAISQVSDISLAKGNYSLARLVMESGGPPISIYLILAALAISLWAIWSSRRRGDTDLFHRDYLVAAIGCAVGLLVLKLVWMHYYVLFLPLLIYLFSPAVKRTPGWGWYAERAAAVAVLLVLFNSPVLIFLTIDSHFLMAALFICGAWELFFLSLRHLQQQLPTAERARADLIPYRSTIEPYATAAGRADSDPDPSR
jgi:hypothetical protein